MWSDNETTKDLLGFAPYAQVVSDLVCDQTLLPLTVGIFGDWGSGKSSLMNMVEHAVTADDVVVVKFQPWLHKDYDDVKGALMVAILDALEERRSRLSKVAGFATDVAERAMHKLAKRVDWMRLVGFLAKTGVGAAMTAAGHPGGVLGIVGGISDIAHIVPKEHATSEKQGDAAPPLFRDDSDVNLRLSNDEPIEREITGFRRDFEDLIEKLHLSALVVLVDDIDRCLPTTIVDVLEAIRLFFAVPRTAFVIGADERIIRHALATKYPEAPELAMDLGREYLEKIIQIPIQVPQLGPDDVQAYMHLLVLQKHLESTDAEGFENLRKLAESHRGKRDVASAMNYGIAEPYIHNASKALHDDLAVISEIAPVLAQFLSGKPREAKRFLNALYMRRALAEKLNLEISFAVLAKMTVLEYFDVDVFKKLFSLRDADGKVPQFVAVEQGKEAPEELAPLLSRLRITRWFASKPPLSDVDLTPYFTLSQARLADFSAGVQQLPANLQHLVLALVDESEGVRSAALDDLKRVDATDQRRVFDALAHQVAQRRVVEAQMSLVDIAGIAPQLRDDLARALSDIPVQSIASTIPRRIQRVIFAGNVPTGQVGQLLERWIGQQINAKLQVAATQAMRPPAPTPQSRRPR